MPLGSTRALPDALPPTAPRPARRPVAVLAIIVASWLLIACGSLSSPTASPSAPPATSSPAAASASASPTAVAWRDYAVEKPLPFTISLPASWEAIDPTQLADAGALAELKERNPGLAGVIDASVEQMRSGSIAFVGLDAASATEGRPFADNVNVVPPRGRLSTANWNRFVTESMVQVRTALKLAAAPRTTAIRLAGADRAVETNYGYELATPDGNRLRVGVQQYLILAGDRPFVLSLTTTQEDLAGRRDLFREIANRFRPSRGS